MTRLYAYPAWTIRIVQQALPLVRFAIRMPICRTRETKHLRNKLSIRFKRIENWDSSNLFLDFLFLRPTFPNAFFGPLYFPIISDAPNDDVAYMHEREIFQIREAVCWAFRFRMLAVSQTKLNDQYKEKYALYEICDPNSSLQS
jgi:hypothetical protein